MLVWLSEVRAGDPALVGGKAARLAAAAAAGFPVPGGFVVPVGESRPPEAELVAAAERLAPLVAVRSSAVAEDLADASFAGLYESYLSVRPSDVPAAVDRCRESARSDRVAAYRSSTAAGGVAVLVQAMVPAEAAGVAFTADPVTGVRDEVVVTAIGGLAESLVAGESGGEEWRLRAGRATVSRASGVLTEAQATTVADLALGLQDLYGGPQDVEWAIAAGKVQLLQTRPMTALPEPAEWTAPGPGLWACNFRVGEWLPEPVTPLFADWLLPVFDAGFRAAMLETTGADVPFPYALVNGWYYATPNPTSSAIPGAVFRTRGRVLRFSVETVVLPAVSPARADRALRRLYRDWHDRLLPAYRELAAVDPAGLDLDELMALTERIVETAGRHFWYLAVVGGAAWKMEEALRRFLRRHRLADVDAAQLLTGLGPHSGLGPHAVHSLDWYHPTAGERVRGREAPSPSHPESERRRLEQRCADRLDRHRQALSTWRQLLGLARDYAQIREEQAANLTLGWPLLRACAGRLGDLFTADRRLDEPESIFFMTADELRHGAPQGAAAGRRDRWQAQRRLVPPLVLGKPPPLIGHRLLGTVVGTAGRVAGVNEIVGQPASAGRATGPACIVHGPDEFTKVQTGDILVAAATTPAWTPLFGRVAGVVTNRGTLAAHASIIAREYGIPAVVATGDATRRLTDGLQVTVDGSRGVVSIHPPLARETPSDDVLNGTLG